MDILYNYISQYVQCFLILVGLVTVVIYLTLRNEEKEREQKQKEQKHKK